MVQKINDQNEVTNKVARAIDEETAGGEGNLVRLSSGVILACQQANPSILIKIMTRVPRPEPPEVFMKDIGKTIENTEDPDYIDRVKSWQMDYNAALLDALIGLGTELESKPDGLPGPDDDEWLKDYEAFHLPMHPESPKWRYITWVQFVAATKDVDTKAIGDAVRKLSGVREADVQSATNFPKSNKDSR